MMMHRVNFLKISNDLYNKEMLVNIINDISFDDIKNELKSPTDKRIYALVEAFKKGFSIESDRGRNKASAGVGIGTTRRA